MRAQKPVVFLEALGIKIQIYFLNKNKGYFLKYPLFIKLIRYFILIN